MFIEKIIDVPENGQIIVQLPSSLRNKKRVKLVIKEVDEAMENKIALL